MSKWQRAPDGRDRRRIVVHFLDEPPVHCWVYRQTEIESTEGMHWVEFDQSGPGAYVYDDQIEDENL